MDPAELERKRQGRDRARALSRDSLARGEGVAWFEDFYRDAGGNPERVPWADRQGNPLLAQWLEARDVAGRETLVVGCGLGEDAELAARAGARVTAFDVAPTAIELCATLWPDSSVRYHAADLFDPPPRWRRRFDLVIEVYTVQALPAGYRARAIARIADFVREGGELVVVTHARPSGAPLPDQIPWPLSPEDLAGFEREGLEQLAITEHVEDDALRLAEDPGAPPLTRWCASYRRP